MDKGKTAIYRVSGILCLPFSFPISKWQTIKYRSWQPSTITIITKNPATCVAKCYKLYYIKGFINHWEKDKHGLNRKMGYGHGRVNNKEIGTAVYIWKFT